MSGWDQLAVRHWRCGHARVASNTYTQVLRGHVYERCLTCRRDYARDYSRERTRAEWGDDLPEIVPMVAVVAPSGEPIPGSEGQTIRAAVAAAGLSRIWPYALQQGYSTKRVMVELEAA